FCAASHIGAGCAGSADPSRVCGVEHDDARPDVLGESGGTDAEPDADGCDPNDAFHGFLSLQVEEFKDARLAQCCIDSRQRAWNDSRRRAQPPGAPCVLTYSE